MKRISPCLFLAAAAAAVLTACSTPPAPPNPNAGEVIVAGELGSGTASYRMTNEVNWSPLRVNKMLAEGATIKTEGDRKVYLFVNRVSTARVDKDAEMSIDKLFKSGSGADGNSATRLNLKSGTVLGNVKKLSKASSYDIVTPQGTAHVRGTQFVITAVQISPGAFQVTFTCPLGALVVEANTGPGGSTVTKVVLAQQAWTPSLQADPVRADESIIKQFNDQLNTRFTFVVPECHLTRPLALPPPFRGNNAPSWFRAW